MNTLLAVVGVALAIIALPWLKRPVEHLIRRVKERVLVGRALQDTLPAVNSIRRGLRSRYSDDFMVCEWNHDLFVDGEGDTNTTIDCLIVNVSDDSHDSIVFPVFFDRAPAELSVWAKTGRTALSVEVEGWDQKDGNGLARIHFPSPLQPRELLRLKWGYGNKGSFQVGDEWWEWFLGRIHSHFRVVITFAKPWVITGLRGLVIPEDHLQASPKIRSGKIYWSLNAPVAGRKYRLEFNLAKKDRLAKINKNPSAK